jgi:hypothetical protein
MPEKTMLPTPCEMHAPQGYVRGAICPRCGRLAPSGDATDTMLATLSRLARFGLDAEGHPLLQSRGDD